MRPLMRAPLAGPVARAIVASALCLVSACGGSGDSSSDAVPATPESVALATIPEPVQLAAADVEHFIAAAGEMKALGVDLDKNRADNSSDLTATMTAWQSNSEVMAILRKHEFDLQRFHRVTYSIMMAVAADEMGKQGGEMEKAKAQLDAMKSQMSPEMFETMKKSQEQAMGMSKQVMNQPAGNVELVRRYRERIDAIGR